MNLVKPLASLLLFVSIAAGTAEAADSPSAKLPGTQAEVLAANYPSLQAALDALPAEGGVVRLPAGRFEISEPLTLTRGDVLISGCGPATWIHNTNTDGKPSLVIQHTDGADVPKAKQLWRVQLADFRLTGNAKSGHGIVADRINEIYLHGLSVSQHGGDGVRLNYCYEDPRIADCLFTYNKQVGLMIEGCHDIVVSANHFEENRDALHCIDSFNLCMTGNNLDDHLGLGVRIENTYGSVLAGNMIEECAAEAIVLDRNCYGITLSANVIAHNGGGIDLVDAHGCTVTGNTLTINERKGVRVGPDSGRIAVTGNNFSDSFIGTGRLGREANDRLAAGLVLEGREVAVSGNVFSGLSTPPITGDDDSESGSMIEGNVMLPPAPEEN